ncbi:MAG TPA: glycosyl hydrolase 53 family protein, partial [Bacteroidales bacterium]|nr:glycosyl hydrolase 53 family protein [Bacteroidales bacterium]
AGLLWPEGHRSNIFQMRALLSEGIRACREASPKTKIMLHYAGHQNALSFFEPFVNLDFDLIGLSYYPIWHGKSLDELGTSIQNLKNTYNKEVIIAETSYPFSFGWADWTNNVLGNSGQIISNFPASPQGQSDFLQALDAKIGEAGGKGWAYWGAEWVASKGDQASNGSSWENQALWDFDFNALPAVNAFVRPVGK